MCFNILSISSANAPCQNEASLQISTHGFKEIYSQSKITVKTENVDPVSLVCFWNSVFIDSMKWMCGFDSCIVYEEQVFVHS